MHADCTSQSCSVHKLGVIRAWFSMAEGPAWGLGPYGVRTFLQRVGAESQVSRMTASAVESIYLNEPRHAFLCAPGGQIVGSCVVDEQRQLAMLLGQASGKVPGRTHCSFRPCCMHAWQRYMAWLCKLTH